MKNTVESLEQILPDAVTVIEQYSAVYISVN